MYIYTYGVDPFVVRPSYCVSRSINGNFVLRADGVEKKTPSTPVVGSSTGTLRPY